MNYGKAPPEKQYVIYSRKSKFTGKGESIENQIELCRQYIAAHYGQKAAENVLVFEDEGFSGGNLERPQFKKMMAESIKTQFAAIVVYRLDRISRNIGDFAKLIEDLGQRNIDFISIREQFDTGSPMGRAMMYIASVFSQLERETIAERIRDNMHELAKTGRWLGGTTPLGYQSEGETKVTVDGKTRKAFHLVPVPEELNLVRLIFEKFMELGSLSKLDQFLLEKRYTTRLGKSFTRFAIKAILTNPVYMIADGSAYDYLHQHQADLYASREDFDEEHGIMAYNRSLQRPGKAMKMRPVNEWIVAVGKHPGLLSGETWVQVQNMLEGNRSKAYRHPRSHVALLSGLLICGDCGDFMRPKLTTRSTATGEQLYVYMCNTKERSRRACCKMKNPTGNILDAKVIAEIKKLAGDNNFFADFLSQSRKFLLAGREGYEAEMETLRESLAENESAIKALVKTLAGVGGTAAEGYITDQIQELHQTGEALKARFQELEVLTEQQHLLDEAFAKARKRLSDFETVVDNCTVEEKRVLLKMLVKRIIWEGENAQIYLLADGENANLPVFSSQESPLCGNSK